MNGWTRSEAIDLMGDMVLALVAIVLIVGFVVYVCAVAWAARHGRLFDRNRRGSGTASSPRREGSSAPGSA